MDISIQTAWTYPGSIEAEGARQTGLSRTNLS